MIPPLNNVLTGKLVKYDLSFILDSFSLSLFLIVSVCLSLILRVSVSSLRKMQIKNKAITLFEYSTLPLLQLFL